MEPPIGLERRFRGLARRLRQQTRYDLLLERLNQPLIEVLRDHEERWPVHRVNPVIQAGPQTELLARHVSPRSQDRLPVGDAHVAVHVIKASPARVGRHPVLGQLPAPALGSLRTLAEHADLGAHRSDLRNPIQSQQLAPFPGRFIPQRLQGAHPCQGHQPQRPKDRFQRVIPLGQREKLPHPPQQPHRQQRRHRAQHPAQGHIIATLEAQRRLRQLPHRGQYPFLGAAGGHSQGPRRVGDYPLGLGAGPDGWLRCGVFFFAPPSARSGWPYAAWWPRRPVAGSPPAPLALHRVIAALAPAVGP
jgi:hypothetical protein